MTATIHAHPPRDEVDAQFPFAEYMKTSAGSSDMVVNGSVSPVVFAINATPTYDTYIASISILIADAGAKLNLFGALAALTNGCDIEWDTQDFGTRPILMDIKQNLDLYRLSDQVPSIVDLSGSGADAVNVRLDLKTAFNVGYGVRLRKGTKDKLTFTINDNLAGITTMNALALGFDF